MERSRREEGSSRLLLELLSEIFVSRYKVTPFLLRSKMIYSGQRNTQKRPFLCEWLTKRLESVAYANLDLGTAEFNVGLLSNIGNAVVVAEDNLEVTCLDAGAAANIHIEGIT